MLEELETVAFIIAFGHVVFRWIRGLRWSRTMDGGRDEVKWARLWTTQIGVDINDASGGDWGRRRFGGEVDSGCREMAW